MRTLRLIPALILALWLVSGVQAATLTQGAYEFELCDPADCTLTGTWLIQDNGAQQYIVAVSAPTDYIEFVAQGQHLIIYRLIGGGFPDMDVCLDAVCQTISNNNIVADYSAGVVIPMSGTHTVQIIGSNVYLDQFIILDVPGSGVFPTPVPTATPINTPVDTPTPMDTPVDTPTPIATATPISYVWAVDPASRYRMVNGQMVRDEYSMSGGDHTLTALLVFVSISSVISLVVTLWKD